MRESLKYLLDKFPSFLDKREGSNFRKVVDVFNTDFKKLRQLLHELDASWDIMCPVLIKRVQVEDFVADYSFLNYLEHPKRATIYKGKDIIFTKYYPYESKSKGDTIIHTLTDTSKSKLNNTLYKIVIETHDEYNYTITTETRNPKLDYIGKFIKCPRRTYNQVDETDYPYTVPTYVSGGSEDDYNYIERMKQYIQYRWKKPLPELYLWQKYNITNKMVNRHHQIFRIASDTFDDENLCGRIANYDLNNGSVFSTFNTTHPILNQTLIINSYFLNNHGEQITYGKLGVFIKKLNDADYLYKGNAPFSLKITEESRANMNVKTAYIGEDVLQINTPLPDNYITSDDETITLGTIPKEEEEEPDEPLMDRVIFVSPTGDDENDGRHRSTPLKTIQYAINKISEEDVIVLLKGTFNIKEPLSINKSCIIIGESNEVEIRNTVNNEWIHINPSNTEVVLTLNSLKLTSNYETYIYNSFTYYTNIGTTKMIISGVEY